VVKAGGGPILNLWIAGLPQTLHQNLSQLLYQFFHFAAGAGFLTVRYKLYEYISTAGKRIIFLLFFSLLLHLKNMYL
jgi:hypothetical protein